MPKKGSLLWHTMDWQERKRFTPWQFWQWVVNDLGRPIAFNTAASHLKKWVARGLIRRLARGVYTTLEAPPGINLKFTPKECKALLKELPNPFTVYDFREAYNAKRGYTAFNHSILTQWQARGLIVKTGQHGWYCKVEKTKQEG